MLSLQVFVKEPQKFHPDFARWSNLAVVAPLRVTGNEVQRGYLPKVLGADDGRMPGETGVL